MVFYSAATTWPAIAKYYKPFFSLACKIIRWHLPPRVERKAVSDFYWLSGVLELRCRWFTCTVTTDERTRPGSEPWQSTDGVNPRVFLVWNLTLGLSVMSDSNCIAPKITETFKPYHDDNVGTQSVGPDRTSCQTFGPVKDLQITAGTNGLKSFSRLGRNSMYLIIVIDHPITHWFRLSQLKKLLFTMPINSWKCNHKSVVIQVNLFILNHDYI